MWRAGWLAAASLLVMAAPSSDGGARPRVELRPIAFADMAGWQDDAVAEALAAFRRGCSVTAPDDNRADLRGPCLAAIEVGDRADNATARRFFEDQFVAHRLVADGQDRGLFTGYYEPELFAARSPSADYPVPLLAPPAGLVNLAGADTGGGLPAGFSHALMRGGALVAAPSRAEIAAGALGPAAEPIAWLADPIDAYFLHVQGSGRLRYGDGSSERVTYAGKNGHPYTSIGRLLIERGIMAKGEVTMQSLRAWLAANPNAGEALMNENRSYVFFRRISGGEGADGPIGQLGVALTPLRSLAVDRAHHAANLPIWLDTTTPDPAGGPGRPFRRLMVAQDTGSAIRGPIRGDIYFGSGVAAGEAAGRMQAEGRMVVLLPRCAIETC